MVPLWYTCMAICTRVPYHLVHSTGYLVFEIMLYVWHTIYGMAIPLARLPYGCLSTRVPWYPYGHSMGPRYTMVRTYTCTYTCTMVLEYVPLVPWFGTRVPWYMCTMVPWCVREVHTSVLEYGIWQYHIGTMVRTGTLCTRVLYLKIQKFDGTRVPWYVDVYRYSSTRVTCTLSQVSKCPARTTTRGTHRRGLPLRPS
jgi:hypothetical protein